MPDFTLLLVNPGSTTTKLGLFVNEKPVAVKKVDHPTALLEQFPNIIDQVEMREKSMVDFLVEHQIEPSRVSAVVGRGGLLKPLPSGVYRVGPKMVDDLRHARYGKHASNMGAVLADRFGQEYKVPAFVVDPVVVDELQEMARFTGLKAISRRSVWHALNANAVVRQVCRNENLDLHKENFVVAHCGGGISVSAFEKGRAIDVSNGLDEGPFTPERAGMLPTIELVKLCFSGKYTHAEIDKMLVGKGGLVDHLGTNSASDVIKRMNKGDRECERVFKGMCYQLVKTIGSYVAVLKGKVTRIILTGGVAHNPELTDFVKEYVQAFAPVVVVPGEDELAALAQGALRVLRGEEEPHDYEALP